MPPTRPRRGLTTGRHPTYSSRGDTPIIPASIGMTMPALVQSPGQMTPWTSADYPARRDRDMLPQVRTTLPPLNAWPARVDLEIYQGDDFLFLVIVTNMDGSPTDLSSADSHCQVRRDFADFEPVIAAELSTDIENNTILCHLANEDTVLMGPINYPTGRLVWDLQLTFNDWFIRTILAGMVIVQPDVTRGPEWTP